MRTVKQEYIVKYYDNGNICSESYRLNGELHNPNGIAYRTWYKNGNIYIEEYWLNGKLHNPNGIAYKSWYENGNIWIEQYWLNGKYLTKEKFDNRNNSSCSVSVSVSGKIVEIDGKKYKLNEV